MLFDPLAGLKQFSLAQHSLIRAVQLQSGNVQAWTNLGTLYLSLGDASLAHQAFAAAQRTEPSYVQCWLGQVHFFICLKHWWAPKFLFSENLNLYYFCNRQLTFSTCFIFKKCYLWCTYKCIKTSNWLFSIYILQSIVSKIILSMYARIFSSLFTIQF